MRLFKPHLTVTIALLTLFSINTYSTQAHAQTGPSGQIVSPDMERYEVTPGRYENQWVPPVYATAYDASGRPFSYVSQPGYSRQVYIEPVYGYRSRPAPAVVYVTQPAYCPPAPTIVYASAPVVCAPAPVVVYSPPPVVYCPPVYCPPPRPAVSVSLGFIFGSPACPPVRCDPPRPRPVYCPPPACEPRRGYDQPRRSGTSVSVNVNVRSRR